MRRIWIAATIALLVGASLGFALGRLTAPTGPVATVRALAAATRANGMGDSAAVTDPASAQRVRAAARQAIDWGADPQLVVGAVVDQMGDDELIALVTSLTDYSREDLEASGDMRAFVQRLAQVAMEGSVVEAAEPGAEVSRVDFAQRVKSDNSAEVPMNRFRTDHQRIYATFPSGEIDEDRVVAKWMRVVDGEVMLLGRYDINASDEWSYVWLGAPPDGWVPGEYRVDFYTADDRLVLLASGSHVISR